LTYKIEGYGSLKETNTVLEALDKNMVFGITKQEDGKFCILENCDGAFYAILTKSELKTLGEEIITLSES